jgi:hypothetical protein
MPEISDNVKRGNEVRSVNTSPNPVVRQLEHPERNITLLFIATAGVFALIGTLLGTFMLAALAGVPTKNFGLSLFSAHPYLQIYGFITEFVVGVSYSLLPRFKVGRIPSIGLGYATYSLLTLANILFLVASALPSSEASLLNLGLDAALLILAGSVAFTVQVIALTSRQAGGFPETNPLIMLSSISLVLISLTLSLKEFGLVSTDEFSSQMIFLALVGFAGSMIYSVEIRSVSFRLSDYRKRLAKLTSVFQACAIGSTFLSLFIPLPFSSSSYSVLLVVGAVCFLTASLCMMFSIKIFELSHPLMYRPAMTKMHFSILRYNEVGIISGSIWLFFGISLGLVLIVTNSTLFFVRDSFIHSIAIGFIGSTIVVFAPMLLPGLLGKRAPISGLSFGSIILLDIAILLRVAGDFGSFVFSSGLPIWESLSGPLIFGSMIWLLIVLHNLGRKEKAEFPGLVALSNPQSFAKGSDKGIRNVRDATIKTTEVSTGKQLETPVWFAEDQGVIYLLPIHGEKTKWYRSVVYNHNQLQIEIDKRTFSGEVKDINEKKLVEKAVNLFKDKCGERVYKNFYRDKIDRAVMVVIP